MDTQAGQPFMKLAHHWGINGVCARCLAIRNGNDSAICSGRKTARQAARDRDTLDGADAQALEGVGAAKGYEAIEFILEPHAGIQPGFSPADSLVICPGQPNRRCGGKVSQEGVGQRHGATISETTG